MDGSENSSARFPLSKPIQFKNEEFADSFLLGDRVNNKKELTEEQKLENAASLISKNSSKNSIKNNDTTANSSGNVHFHKNLASTAVTSTPLVLNRASSSDENNNSTDKSQPRWKLLQKLKDSKPLIFDLDPPNGKKKIY